MSRATRQEVLIRSLIEALCLTLKAKLVGQPGEESILMATDVVLYLIEELAQDCPITLLPREAGKVILALDWFRREQNTDLDLQSPEALTAMAMGLADRLAWVVKNPAKAQLITTLNKLLQNLYDTFDHQGKKLDLLTRGAAICDQLLAKEI